jgi:MazG family protein
VKEQFAELVNIMATLRSEGGCPWDIQQTHESLRQYLLEEAYEVIETIDEKRFDDLKEELGDLLLQVIFHAQIAAEENLFTIEDVLAEINTKLIRRHPHVFGETKIETADQQKVHWEQIKKSEGKQSAIDGVPKELSALLRAHRIQGKAATVGFDWERVEHVWEKVYEELGELRIAWRSGKKQEIESEFGDLLFSLVNVSRFIGVNPEDSLRSTIEKFIRRFHEVEKEMVKRNKRMEDATLKEMDEVWDTVKVREQRKKK